MTKLKFKKFRVEDQEIDLESGEINDDPRQKEEEEQEEGKKPKKKRKSTIEALKEFLNERYSFRFNTVTKINEFYDMYGEEEDYRGLETRETNDIILEAMESVSGRGLEGVFNKVINSSYVKSFNPIEEYFRGLQWDGKSRLNKLISSMAIHPQAITYTHDKQQHFTNTVDEFAKLLPKWLMACIHCGLGKGENQSMLMFIGGQGKGKTYWLDNLCPEPLRDYAYTGHIETNIGKDATANILAEKFWCNIDDQMESIFGKDYQSIKGIISASSVTNRKAYAKDAPKRKRIVNFVGSVNPDQIFMDVENRRYLTFKISEETKEPIKHKLYNEIDIDQLWAEIYERYKKGEAFKFGAKEFAIINAINNHFLRLTSEEEMLIKYFRPCNTEEEQEKAPIEYLQHTEILSKLQMHFGGRMYARTLTNALEKHGFWRVSKRINGGSPRYVYPVVELV